MRDRNMEELGESRRNHVEFCIETGEYLSIIDGLRFITREKDSALLNIDSNSKIVVRSNSSNVINYINGIIPGERNGIYKIFKSIIQTTIIGYPHIEFTHV